MTLRLAVNSTIGVKKLVIKYYQKLVVWNIPSGNFPLERYGKLFSVFNQILRKHFVSHAIFLPIHVQYKSMLSTQPLKYTSLLHYSHIPTTHEKTSHTPSTSTPKIECKLNSTSETSGHDAHFKYIIALNRKKETAKSLSQINNQITQSLFDSLRLPTLLPTRFPTRFRTRLFVYLPRHTVIISPVQLLCYANEMNILRAFLCW